MSETQNCERETWQRFVDFLYASDGVMTVQELDDCVGDLGIDVELGFARFQELIERRRRRVRLERAGQQRESLQQRLKGVVAPKVSDLKARVRNLVQSSGDEKQRLAYFHKLENAESKSDLQSLLDDLEKLDAFSEFDDEA